MKDDLLLNKTQKNEEKPRARTYVQIPTKIFAFESKFFLENDELLVYYFLGTMVLARDFQKVECNIDLLYAKMNFGYFGFADDSKNKKRIREALIGLHDKGYILLPARDKDLRNNTFLDISIPKVDTKEEISSGSYTFKGFENIFFDTFEVCKASGKQCVNHFKVLIYIQWREKIGFEISLSQWEKVLDVSNKTADKILDECISANLIRKERGQYYLDVNGKLKQETNKYSLINEEERVSSSSNKASFEKRVNTRIKATKEELKTTEKRQSNMFTQKKMDFNDYKIWKTTDCEIFKAYGKRRLDALSKTSASFLIENWEKDYQNELAKERKYKQQIEFANTMSEISASEMRDDRALEYKKKQIHIDMSEFLEDEPEKNTGDGWIFDDMSDEAS